MKSWFPRLRRLLLASTLLAISACATAPPVQEMSDARQAIAAAREVGAETYDPGALQLAESSLGQAEKQLQQRLYWEAKRSALAAKDSALAALLRSRSLREEAASPTPASPAAAP